MKSYPDYSRSRRHAWGLWIVAAVLLVGCAGNSPRRDDFEDRDRFEEPASDMRPIEMTPVNPNNVAVEPSFYSPQTPSSPVRPNRELGWVVTNPRRDSVLDVIQRAPEFGVTHVQIGGDILQSVDDLIFNAEKQQLVREIAQSMERVGIDTYIWCHELNLDGRTFRFHLADPLVEARKAAYRNVLTQIPELDGVVLLLNHSKLEPWEAEIPSDQVPQSMPERIRFVVEMVRSSVVGEMGKRLLVRADTDRPEENQWFEEAFGSYPTGEVTLMTPLTQTGQVEVGPVRPLVKSLSAYRPLIEMDLTGEMFGGPYFVYCLPDALRRDLEDQDTGSWAGLVGWVQTQYGSPIMTPNEINLQALSEISKSNWGMTETLWETWITRRYGLQPMSQESLALKRILRSSFEWGQKMVLVKGLLPVTVEGELPSDVASLQQYWSRSVFRSDPRMAQIDREIENRRKQFLIEMGQESFEAAQAVDEAIRELPALQSSLAPPEYALLSQRLQEQRRMADVDYYVKQCVWGYLFWKKNRDEMEALYLEAHLQKLEQLAGAMEGMVAGPLTPGKAAPVRALAASIRQEFPRVLLGSRERTWNHLREITVRQAGAERVEIIWKSDEPSLSKAFYTTNLPVFDQFQDVSTAPSTEHRIVIQGLQPGKGYYFKFQCVTSGGDVTNSGNFYIRLEPPAMI